MAMCIVGSTLLSLLPGMMMFIVFSGACFCFIFVAINKHLWGLLAAQVVCLVMNCIGIIGIIRGTWG
jgi:hypothetical protein